MHTSFFQLLQVFYSATISISPETLSFFKTQLTGMAITCEWVSKLCIGVTSWFCCKVALLISVLVFAHSIVEHAVVAILISYLTSNWENDNLRKAATIVNAQEGLSGVLIIVVAHIADTYTGRFKMVSLSTVAYVVGLVLLWLLNPADKIGIFFVAGVLIAFGQAGREPPLKAFLADQFRNKEQSLGDHEKQVEDRTNILWRCSYFLGAAAVVLGLDFAGVSWKYTFMISAIVMGVAFLFFMYGFTCYYREKPTGSPLTTVFRVFVAAISKRKLPYSNEPGNYYQNVNDHVPLLPDSFLFRWLDKAAILEGSNSPSKKEQEKKRKLCTVTQVMEVKLLLRMLPMWTIFLVYCLVDAVGSTFFFEQSSNLKDHIGNNLRVPIVFFYLIKSFSKYTIAYLYKLIIPKGWSDEQKRFAVKVRIGVGLLCSMLCCITARLVEVHRLHLVIKEGFVDDQDKTIAMSIFWLTPQFCLLGLMEGLTEDGIVDFFYYRVAESMKSYGPSFNDCVVGIGKFISIFWVLTFRRWFGDTVNHSRLDNYYGILAILSIGNFIFYASVSKYFYRVGGGVDMNLDKILEDVVRGSATHMS